MALLGVKTHRERGALGISSAAPVTPNLSGKPESVNQGSNGWANWKQTSSAFRTSVAQSATRHTPFGETPNLHIIL